MARAKRYNQGKPPLHYLDTFDRALYEVAKVFDYGATKYSDYNYLLGSTYTENFSSARRHMMKSLKGLEHDKEAAEAGFEIDHLAFAAWNILRMLDEKLNPRPGTEDDRPHKVLERGGLDEAAPAKELMQWAKEKGLLHENLCPRCGQADSSSPGSVGSQESSDE